MSSFPSVSTSRCCRWGQRAIRNERSSRFYVEGVGFEQLCASIMKVGDADPVG